MLWGEAATNADSSAFETTALALQLQDKALAFSGKTYPSRHNFSLWSALNLVEGNKSVSYTHLEYIYLVCMFSLTYWYMKKGNWKNKKI